MNNYLNVVHKNRRPVNSFSSYATPFYIISFILYASRNLSSDPHRNLYPDPQTQAGNISSDSSWGTIISMFFP